MSEEKAKNVYEVGEIPELGHVPEKMYAWTIRRERHGVPEKSFQIELVPTPKVDSNEVLVFVMAAGVNYNGIWAGLGEPISPFDVHKADYHIAGSDASGIVWAVGEKVNRWKVGDEVVIHCNQDDGDDEPCNGGDPMYSPSQRIWGYETPDGSFSQFTAVQSQQLMSRPKHLTWEEAACYTLTLATAYRMLFGHAPHELRPGQNVLVWGASGGLGSYAIQLINTAGADIKKYRKDALAQPETRKEFYKYLNLDLLDVFESEPKKNSYTFFDYKTYKFGKEEGIRIDFFLISPFLKNKIMKVKVLKEYRDMERPSDHCPILMDLNI